MTAIGYKDGLKSSSKLVTSSTPTAIKATVDKSILNQGDVAHVIVQLLDSNGYEVKHTNKQIHFDIPEGLKNMGVDNGYYRNVQNYQSNKIVTHKGRTLLIIKASTIKGSKTIKVSGEGLKSSLVEISIETDEIVR